MLQQIPNTNRSHGGAGHLSRRRWAQNATVVGQTRKTWFGKSEHGQAFQPQVGCSGASCRESQQNALEGYQGTVCARTRCLKRLRDSRATRRMERSTPCTGRATWPYRHPIWRRRLSTPRSRPTSAAMAAEVGLKLWEWADESVYFCNEPYSWFRVSC